MNDKNKKVTITISVVILAVLIIGAASYATIKFLSNEDQASIINNTIATEATLNLEPVTTNFSEVPTDLPSEVPLFEEATLINASVTTFGSDTKKYSLSFQSDQSTENVFAFYKSELSKNGWQTDSVHAEDTLKAVSASNTARFLTASISMPTSSQAAAGSFYLLSVTLMTSPQPSGS